MMGTEIGDKIKSTGAYYDMNNQCVQKTQLMLNNCIIIHY